MSRFVHACGLAACLLLLVGGGAAEARKRLKLPRDVEVPNDAALAVYMPAAALQARFYLDNPGLWITPGQALANARDEVGEPLFQRFSVVSAGQPARYGLLLDIDPEWAVERGKITLKLDYRVFDAADREVSSGSVSRTERANKGGTGGGFGVAAVNAMQELFVEVLTELKPSAQKYAEAPEARTPPADLLVNRDEPVSTGSGFYINPAGQVLTAAHVLSDCMLIELGQDGQATPAVQVATSRLLDLAVLDTGRTTDGALPMRIGQTYELGESVTNIGYPLQGLLVSSPNVTRGNVSSRSGLQGSQGLFQFSAPIQSGSSGGPVISETGEVLGVTVGTLNSGSLVERGLVPQNVNFALDAGIAARFLRRHGIDFAEVTPEGRQSLPVEASLASVVQLSCYQ